MSSICLYRRNSGSYESWGSLMSTDGLISIGLTFRCPTLVPAGPKLLFNELWYGWLDEEGLPFLRRGGLSCLIVKLPVFERLLFLCFSLVPVLGLPPLKKFPKCPLILSLSESNWLVPFVNSLSCWVCTPYAYILASSDGSLILSLNEVFWSPLYDLSTESGTKRLLSR